MTIRCSQCNQLFPTLAARKLHVRNIHQASVIVQLLDGSQRCIRRDSRSNLFTCPVSDCSFVNDNPGNFKRHVSSCCQSLEPNAEILPNDSGDPHQFRFQYGYWVHEEFNLIICKSCRYALNPVIRTICRHSKRKHQQNITPSDVKRAMSILDSEIVGSDHHSLRKFMIPGSELIEPVQGIKLHYGFQCVDCSYYCREAESIRKHWSIIHAGSISQSSVFRQVHVQTLFKGPKTRFFGVNALQPLKQTVELDARDVDAAFEALHLNNPTIAVSALLDEHTRHPFFRSTNWDRLIENDFQLFDPAILIEIVALANDHDPLENLVLDACIDYIDTVHNLLLRVPFVATRKILSGNS
uniref:C2H2-type domain-containing protein n=1 Tax=Spongospora subterranea TaxID=70186 RepID=A0A0H5R3T4_9EUKA|eukprot:CRZ08517.1 hypothetical protein [Spongospora subterranea]